jgi:hypothetical protein
MSRSKASEFAHARSSYQDGSVAHNVQRGQAAAVLGLHVSSLCQQKLHVTSG